jgi:hypothetical protein
MKGAILFGGLSMKTALVLFLSLGLTSAALAGASSNNVPQPDEAAKTMNRAGIQDRAFKGCVAQQTKMAAVPAELIDRGCSCYASRTVQRMSNREVDAFRQTGFFNDETRDRAFKALDACGLKRPA